MMTTTTRGREKVGEGQEEGEVVIVSTELEVDGVWRW